MKKQQSSAVVEPIVKLQHYRDFSDKDLFVGIDMHKENYQVSVVNEGVILSNVHMEASHDKLVYHLTNRYGQARFHCVYESGGWGFTLYRRLVAEGMDCILVNAADIPGTDKERCSKTDKVDARKLALQHCKGNLAAIHVPDEKLQKQRSLMRIRKSKIRELMQTERFQRNSNLLCSIPGIGVLTAMHFLLEVGDPRRFTSFDKLSNFIGLCPDSHSSGTTDKHTGITRRRHKNLRCQLVEASWRLIRRDVAMLEYYQSYFGAYLDINQSSTLRFPQTFTGDGPFGGTLHTIRDLQPVSSIPSRKIRRPALRYKAITSRTIRFVVDLYTLHHKYYTRTKNRLVYQLDSLIKKTSFFNPDN